MRFPIARLHPQAAFALREENPPLQWSAALAQIVRMNASRPVNKQMPAEKAASQRISSHIETANHLKMIEDSSGRRRKSPLYTMA
jgi:hypothetical protein